MILKAKPEGNILFLDLEGHLDFETTSQLSNLCVDLMKQNKTNRLIFNFERLKFVGSCGIHQFIRVLKDFNDLEEKPKYINVSSEFSKMFKAFQNNKAPFEVFESREAALKGFPAEPPKTIVDITPTSIIPAKKTKKRLDA